MLLEQSRRNIAGHLIESPLILLVVSNHTITIGREESFEHVQKPESAIKDRRQSRIGLI